MVYYKVTEGIGNVIETIPAYNFLVEKFGDVTVSSHKAHINNAKLVYGPSVIEWSAIPPNSQIFDCALVPSIPRSWKISEVSLNLQKVGAPPDRTDVSSFFEEKITSGEVCDIIICDGFKNDKWAVKSYPYWDKVAEAFPDLKVASVGLKNQYVKSTIDKTDIGFSETLSLIKSCKVFIGNDSGLYHAAAAMRKNGVVVFTATAVEKNHDNNFHSTITPIVNSEVDCRPCHNRYPGAHWIKVGSKCKWKCREIDPTVIIEECKKWLM